jgi:hypothetical protein
MELPGHNREQPPEHGNPFVDHTQGGSLTPEGGSTATPAQSEITAPAYPSEQLENPQASTEAVASTEIATRTVETEIGPITVVNRPDSLQTYGPDDLAALLKRRSPHTLSDIRKGHNIKAVPGNDDVVLRWDYPRELEPDAVVERVETYERELTRLQKSGIRLLRRSVFVVHQDRSEGPVAEPTIYMAVERRDPAALNQLPLDDPEACRINQEICANLATYFIETPPGEDFIFESISQPYQYAADGALFDYGTHISVIPETRLTELDYVLYWNNSLTQNDLTRETSFRIAQALEEPRNRK